MRISFQSRPMSQTCIVSHTHTPLRHHIMDHHDDDDAAIAAASKVPPPLIEPCAVCGTQEAVARARRNSKPLCLLHHVTTTPQNAPPHSLIGESAAAATAQLPHAQAVFAQAFLEVRQEVQELLEEQRKEAAKVHKKKAKKNDDPLAILSSFHGTTKKKKKRKQSPAVKGHNIDVSVKDAQQGTKRTSASTT